MSESHCEKGDVPTLSHFGVTAEWHSNVVNSKCYSFQSKLESIPITPRIITKALVALIIKC